MSDEDDKPYPPSLHREQRGAVLAFSIFAAPIAWLLHLVVSFAIVEPMCGEGTRLVVHTLLTVVALFISIPGGVLAYRSLRSASEDDARARSPGAGTLAPPSGSTDGRSGARTRLLPATAVGNSALFSLIIILSWTAALVVPPCAR